MNERERVTFLARRFAAAGASVRTGIGDDAAVLLTTGLSGPLVWTVDAQVEGTHFRRDWLSWQDVGWRSFMAASSDLAAMGAEPLAALSALVLADDVDDAAFDALTEGQVAASNVVGAQVVGGNLARGKETSITTTLLGHAKSPLLRSGARAGDGIFLGGDVGLAAAGLALLEAPGAIDMQDAHISVCLDAWRRPRALVELGGAARDVATAAIDISDGLACDANHVAEASSVALVFDEAALRAMMSPALVAASALMDRDPLEFLLGGGEDYALLVTGPPSSVCVRGLVRVGVVEAGSPAVFVDGASGRRAVPRAGFDHFA